MNRVFCYFMKGLLLCNIVLVILRISKTLKNTITEFITYRNNIIEYNYNPKFLMQNFKTKVFYTWTLFSVLVFSTAF
jgi:hypothetical protein